MIFFFLGRLPLLVLAPVHLDFQKIEFAFRACGSQGSAVGAAAVLVQVNGSFCFCLRLSGNPIERCGFCVW